MPTQKLKIREEGTHRKNCAALIAYERDHIWGSPWFLSGEVENRASTGRRHQDGRTPWMLLQCNDPDCSARLWVEKHSLEDVIERERKRLANQ